MIIYDNETTSKIYPDINPTIAQESKTYRLKNQLKLKHICLMKMNFVKELLKN